MSWPSSLQIPTLGEITSKIREGVDALWNDALQWHPQSQSPHFFPVPDILIQASGLYAPDGTPETPAVGVGIGVQLFQAVIPPPGAPAPPNWADWYLNNSGPQSNLSPDPSKPITPLVFATLDDTGSATVPFRPPAVLDDRLGYVFVVSLYQEGAVGTLEIPWPVGWYPTAPKTLWQLIYGRDTTGTPGQRGGGHHQRSP